MEADPIAQSSPATSRGIRWRVTKSVKSLLGSAAGVSGVYSRSFDSQMIVVAFHRVNDRMPEDGLTCGSRKFAAFCEFFRKRFRVVPFAEQVAGCREGRDMGGTLSITFDDGYVDNFEVAAPVLKSYGLPATFFISTGFIGSNRVPFWDSQLPVQPGWMNWEQVRGLASMGFDIGAHTHTHIDMGKCATDLIREELALSRDTLRRELGRKVDLFVYPFGGRDNITDQAIELVKEAGFQSCASCHGGVNPRIADPYRIRRIGIAEWFSTPDELGFELVRGTA